MSTIEQSHSQDKPESSTWHNGLSLIFWGLILVFIKISIDGFDLLPDGIGYTLIALGTARFARLSSQFTTASALSWVLLLIWCANLFAPGSFAWGYVVTAFSFAMQWFLLGGIIDVAVARNRPDIADRTSIYRVIYTAVTVVGMFIFLTGQFAYALAVIATIAGFAISVLILHLIYRVRHQLA